MLAYMGFKFPENFKQNKTIEKLRNHGFYKTTYKLNRAFPHSILKTNTHKPFGLRGAKTISYTIIVVMKLLLIHPGVGWCHALGEHSTFFKYDGLIPDLV